MKLKVSCGSPLFEPRIRRDRGMQNSFDELWEFVNNGEHFWQLARGIDDRAVIADREAKLISHETTFAEDI